VSAYFVLLRRRFLCSFSHQSCFGPCLLMLRKCSFQKMCCILTQQPPPFPRITHRVQTSSNSKNPKRNARSGYRPRSDQTQSHAEFRLDGVLFHFTQHWRARTPCARTGFSSRRKSARSTRTLWPASARPFWVAVEHRLREAGRPHDRELNEEQDRTGQQRLCYSAEIQTW
jgi:hypothetical protein